jgi:hypothetical protein
MSPLLTVDSKGSKFVVIPAGSVVNTSKDFPGPGFHPVVYNGQNLLAFTRDIRERTEQVFLSGSVAARKLPLVTNCPLYFTDTLDTMRLFGKDRTQVSNVVRLRVTDTILAVSPTPTNSALVMIPVGAVIQTSDNMNTLGLHPVNYDGRELLVFTRDIRERTVRLSSAEA